MKRLTVVLPVVLLTLAACRDATSPGLTLASLAGTYTLQTVNGASLPLTLQNTSAQKVDLLSGDLMLSPSGAARETAIKQWTYPTTSVQTLSQEDGTVALSGDTITVLHARDGAAGVGRLVGSTLTFVRQDTTWAYGRQP